MLKFVDELRKLGNYVAAKDCYQKALEDIKNNQGEDLVEFTTNLLKFAEFLR